MFCHRPIWASVCFTASNCSSPWILLKVMCIAQALEVSSAISKCITFAVCRSLSIFAPPSDFLASSFAHLPNAGKLFPFGDKAFKRERELSSAPAAVVCKSIYMCSHSAQSSLILTLTLIDSHLNAICWKSVDEQCKREEWREGDFDRGKRKREKEIVR